MYKLYICIVIYKSKYNIQKVLEALLSLGWMVKSTIDCSKKDNDKNSFFFERCNPIETSVAVVSLLNTMYAE